MWRKARRGGQAAAQLSCHVERKSVGLGQPQQPRMCALLSLERDGGLVCSVDVIEGDVSVCVRGRKQPVLRARHPAG